MPVQSATVKQLSVGGVHVPLVGAGLLHVLPAPQSASALQVGAEQDPATAQLQVAPAMPVQSEAAKQLSAGCVQVPLVGAGLEQVLPAPQSVADLHVVAEQDPNTGLLQVAPVMPVQSEAAKQVSAGCVQVPLVGAGLVQVPVPQSAVDLQVLAEQVPFWAPPQVALALMLVQSVFAQQLVVGNLQVPATAAGLVQVPVPQSAVVLQVAAEHAPLTSPVHVNLELILVQSEAAQQLIALGEQVPADEPVQVPTPQLAFVVQLSAEQVPCVAPLHFEVLLTLLQSVFAKQPTLQLPV